VSGEEYTQTGTRMNPKRISQKDQLPIQALIPFNHHITQFGLQNAKLDSSSFTVLPRPNSELMQPISTSESHLYDEPSHGLLDDYSRAGFRENDLPPDLLQDHKEASVQLLPSPKKEEEEESEKEEDFGYVGNQHRDHEDPDNNDGESLSSSNSSLQDRFSSAGSMDYIQQNTTGAGQPLLFLEKQIPVTESLSILPSIPSDDF
jgi:hypothetical protein